MATPTPTPAVEGTDRTFNRGFAGKKDARGPKRDDKSPFEDWTPVTKLGRLVHARKIKSVEDIYSHALPIKEAQIVDFFFPKKDLQQEVMKIKPVQKQTTAGQRTRFKAVVVVGDCNGHVGLGAKVSTEVQLAIQGAVLAAKLSIVPIRRGYWGNKIGDVHTVPMKVTGQCGSVRVRLVPAPRGTGIVGAPASKKVLQFAGVGDCFTKSSGCTRTLENFVGATFDAIRQTYGYLTPDLWGETKHEPSPYQTWSDWLSTSSKAH